jgi:hypothetical protein
MIGKLKCFVRRIRGGTHIWAWVVGDPSYMVCTQCDARYHKPVPLIERIMNRLGYIRTCKIIRPRGVFIRGCREWTKKGKG